MDETNILAKKTYMSKINKSKETSQAEEVNFTELYRKNANQVFYYLYSRLRNVADAEDLTSQTFVTALENLSQLRDPLKFTPWVFTIARNKVNDFFRKSQRHPTVDYGEELEQFKEVGRVLSPAEMYSQIPAGKQTVRISQPAVLGDLISFIGSWSPEK